MKTSLDEFLKNKLPKPLDEFSMFSGKFAKELMEQYASLREKETEQKTIQRICHKAAKCACTPGGMKCPPDAICPI